MRTSGAKGQIVSAMYQGMEIHFTGEAWFNATEAAARFGKNPHEWLRLPDTKQYIQAMERTYGKIPYVKTSRTRADRGGGTWMHPKLAVAFARWLDVGFSLWCDMQIDSLLRAPYDRDRVRLKASTTFKCLTDMVKLKREADGKVVAAHHFSNEARLVNFALTGEFCSVDRDSLASADMELLVRLEELDIMLIGSGVEYEERKTRLVAEAEKWRANRSMPVQMH